MKQIQLLSAALFSLVILGLSGCQTEVVPPINEVTYASKLSEEPVLVQSFMVDGVSAEEIENSIVQAATKRGWDVTDLGEEGIAASLVHRGYDSTLTFEYGEGWVKIYSVSYEIDKESKVREERAEPESWIRNLHKDILEILGRLPTT